MKRLTAAWPDREIAGTDHQPPVEVRRDWYY